MKRTPLWLQLKVSRPRPIFRQIRLEDYYIVYLEYCPGSCGNKMFCTGVLKFWKSWVSKTFLRTLNRCWILRISFKVLKRSWIFFFSNCWTEDRSQQTLGQSKISTWNRILGLLGCLSFWSQPSSSTFEMIKNSTAPVCGSHAFELSVCVAWPSPADRDQDWSRSEVSTTSFGWHLIWLEVNCELHFFQSVCAFHLLLFSPIQDWLPMHILFFHWTSSLCASALPRVYEFIRKRVTRSDIFGYQFRVVESSKTFHPVEKKELYFFLAQPGEEQRSFDSSLRQSHRSEWRLNPVTIPAIADRTVQSNFV